MGKIKQAFVELGKVAPTPLEEYEHTVSEADDFHQMDEKPHQPGQEA